jgi:hypothetical protein
MLFVAAYLKALSKPNLAESNTLESPPEDVAQRENLINQLLEPLRQRQETAGTAYMTLVQQSAAKAADLHLAR